MSEDVSISDPVFATEQPTGRRRSDRIVGAGRAMHDVVERAKVAARTDRPVLVTGAAGSGKEHLARAIHAWSARAGGPCVVVPASALSEALAAREIFGCSENVHPLLPDEYAGGLARTAGGTFIVTHIDRLPEAVTRALAKACIEGRFKREGDGAVQPLRARVFATANATPERAPFGDAPTHEIAVPSLADRREDVLPLAAYFLRLASDDEGIQPVGFTADARAALLGESWPGNVRELGERIRQAVRLAGDGAISAEALLLSVDGDNVPSFKEAKRAFETRYVVGLLRRCGGNISRAARLAKKDRKDFYDVIRRTGVNPSDFR
jgi:two-component system response regulator GlrR